MHEEGERSGEEMCEADPTFIRACQEYSEKGFSPTLTKEQLKATILLRRVSAGEEEPKIDDEKPEVKHPLSKEELTRIEARKKCNRLSARKCREKKKQENQQVYKRVEEEEQRKKALEKKIADMESEKNTMLKKLSETYSRLQSTVITPAAIMDLVADLIQNGAETQQNGPDVITVTTPCHEVPWETAILHSAPGVSTCTSDVHMQTGQSYYSNKHFDGISDLQGQSSLGCADTDIGLCSNNCEWNDYFVAEN
nr:uncharacterized protein LOC111119890 isoform X2 [Crassostrea virginica]